jgi:hypothetical protein
MPFIFRCSQCGLILHRDRQPILCNWSFKQQTYLEYVFEMLGGKCPFCGNKLKIPPLEIKITIATTKKRKLKRPRR